MRIVTVAALVMSVTSSAFAENQSQMAIFQACKSDIETLCAGIQPGGGRIGECLKANKEKLSAGCKAAMIEAFKAKQAEQPASQPAAPTAQTTETPPPQ